MIVVIKGISVVIKRSKHGMTCYFALGGQIMKKQKTVHDI